MEKAPLQLLIGLFSLLLVSCSGVLYPIDPKPVIPIDNRFIGTWKFNDPQERETTITIKKHDSYTYRVTYKDRLLGDTSSNLVYISTIYNRLYFNLIIPDSPVSYIIMPLMKINATASRFTLAIVKDSMLNKAHSEAEVRNILTDNFDNKEYYKDTAELIRIH